MELLSEQPTLVQPLTIFERACRVSDHFATLLRNWPKKKGLDGGSRPFMSKHTNRIGG